MGTHLDRSEKIRKIKSEDTSKDLWDIIKQNKICIIGVPGEERRKDQRTYLKI